MQGRLQGKRLDRRRTSSTTVADHGAEACNYLLAVDVEMNTVDGYAMSSWERGYGDFVMRPTSRRCAGRRGWTARRCASPTCSGSDGAPVVASPRQILRAQLERLAERGWTRHAGTELEFMVFNDSYEEAWDKGYRDLDPGQPLQRRLLDARHGAGRAAAPPDPQRDGGRGHGASRTPRASATSASTRSTSSTPTRCDRRRARHLQERRQGDRRPGGHGDHLHGEVQRARGQLVPHPPVAARTTTARVFAEQQRLFDRFLAGHARGPARADAVLAPEHQLLQALRGGRRSRRRRSPGATTTAPARCASSATAPASASSAGAGRRRQPVPRAQRADRRRPARGRRASSSSSRRCEGNAYEATDKPQRARGRCATRATCSRPARSRATAFGEEVVDHYLNNARVELDGVRRGGHGLGALPRLRAAVGSSGSSSSRSRRRSSSSARRLSVTECISSRARRATSFPLLVRLPHCPDPLPRSHRAQTRSPVSSDRVWVDFHPTPGVGSSS